MARALAAWAPTAGRGVLAACLGVSFACGVSEETPLSRAPTGRPADGLLGDPELQEVVELQVRRDWTALSARLGHPRAVVRARAALALGSVQAPETMPVLVAALADTSAPVRRDASFALGQVGRVDAVPALAAALASEANDQVRGRLIEALGKLPASASASALLAHVAREGEAAARVLALARLGAVGGVVSEPLVDTLIGRLTDRDPDVRMGAAYFFGRLAEPGPWAPKADQVRSALAGYSLADPAAMYLVQGLGRLGSVDDAERLRHWAATAADWRTRANAMAALTGRRLDATTREVLLRGLDDPSVHVAVNAARGLGQGAPDASLLLAMRAWISEHYAAWQVAGPLLEALARAGDEEFVLEWIDARPPEDEARTWVGPQALVHLRGEKAFERLRATAAAPPEAQRSRAFAGLVERWRWEQADAQSHERYLEIFLEALGSDDARRRSLAATVLADSVLADLGGLAALERAAGSEDPGLRRVADRALRRARGDGVGPPPSGTSAPGPQGGELDERARLDWDFLAALGPAPRLILETDRGRVVLRLDPEAAPQTVQTIARFADSGSYDGVAFHRVVPNFVIQGGDFSRGDGSGGPGFTIRSELNLLRYVRGVIGMASAGKDTEGSQFFITHSMQPHLDGGYTSFGWVEEGMDVVDRIRLGDHVRRASVAPGD